MTKPDFTLCEFLAANGGVKDFRGELKALDAQHWHRAVPFRRKLVRDNGMSLDRARELAQEAGYIRDADGTGTSVADLLNAIDRDLHHGDVFSVTDDARYESAEREAIQAEARGELAPSIEFYERPYTTKRGRAGVSYYAKVTLPGEAKPGLHSVWHDDPELRANAVSAFIANASAALAACPF